MECLKNIILLYIFIFIFFVNGDNMVVFFIGCMVIVDGENIGFIVCLINKILILFKNKV